MDKDGYPDEKELTTIINWDALKDPIGLISYIQDIWAYADYFYYDFDTGRLEMHTAGWSGNEDIMEALRSNDMFWALYWMRSKRGGHYYFHVKIYEEPDPLDNGDNLGESPDY
jgi:hypothetical protein